MYETVFLILIIALGILHTILMGLTFGIAFFYEKVFKRRAFSSLFIIAAILFVISFFIFYSNLFSDLGSAFFAAGGILLAILSLRLYSVMTGG